MEQIALVRTTVIIGMVCQQPCIMRRLLLVILAQSQERMFFVKVQRLPIRLERFPMRRITFGKLQWMVEQAIQPLLQTVVLQ